MKSSYFSRYFITAVSSAIARLNQFNIAAATSGSIPERVRCELSQAKVVCSQLRPTTNMKLWWGYPANISDEEPKKCATRLLRRE